MCSAFLWSGSPNIHNKAKVAWEKVCLPKCEGGLRLRRLREVSKVLALSLICKLFTMSGSLWVAWMNHNLLHHGSFWDACDTTIGSWTWRKLLKLRPFAAGFLKAEIRDDNFVFFWSDYWLIISRLIDLIGEVGTRQLGIRGMQRSLR